MKVLGILGSPRRGGNAEILLDRALEGAKSAGAHIEKIVLNELMISPCQECNGCAKDGKCVIDDEMQLVYQKVDEADILILASPIFFGSLPAQVKAMIDRYQCRWQAKYVLHQQPPVEKKAKLILVSAANRDRFFKNAESIVENLFAVLDIRLTDTLYCPDTDEKGKILQQRQCLERALDLGKRI